VKLSIAILSLFLFSNSFSQNIQKDWESFYKEITTNKKLPLTAFETFEKKYDKEFEKNPDIGTKFYSCYAYALCNEKDYKNDLEALKYAYFFANKSSDTTLKHIVVYRFGDIYRLHKNWTEAEKYYYTCMRPLSAILGVSNREYSDIYFEYTIVIVNLRKFKEAKPAAEGLMFYYKTLDGDTSYHYNAMFECLAYINHQLGDYQKAISQYSQLVQAQSFLRLRDTSRYVSNINSLGDVYRDLSRYKEAMMCFDLAKTEYARLKMNDLTELGSIENGRALCFKTLGKYREAEEAFENSLSLYRKKDEMHTRNYCVALNNFGDMYRELGRHGRASEILLQSLEIQKKYLDTKDRCFGNTLNNLGLVYLDAQLYEESEKRFLEALDVYEISEGKESPYYGNCLNSISSIYLLQNNFKKAEEYKIKALEITANTVGKDHYRYASFLISTYGIYFRSKQYDKAEKNLREALVLAEKNFGKQHELYCRAQLNLAETFAMQGKYDLAWTMWQPCLQYYNDRINGYFDAMSEENQGHYFNLIAPAFEAYTIYLLNFRLAFPKKDLSPQINAALRNQLLIKSLLSRNSGRLQKLVYESKDEELMKTYQEWIDIKNVLVNNSKSSEAMVDENELLKKATDLEAAIKSKFPMVNESAATYESIKTKLQVNEAAIDIFRAYEWLTDSTSVKRYGAIIVKKNSAVPELVIYKNGDELDGRAFDKYYSAIEDQKKDSLSFASYYKPLQNSLKDVRRLYISADGVFQKVSLTGLYDPSTKKFVNDEKDISLMSNLSSLTGRNDKIVSRENSAMLFGYPDYEYDFKTKKTVQASSSIVASRYGLNNLVKLPGTKKEIDEIAKSLSSQNWKVESFSEEKASEENLRKVNAPKILHIATHGYYLSDVETDEKLLLGFDSKNLRENSFLRSGIILAGAGPSTADSLNTNSENDGIVTAMEASQLNLNGTEVVVLSACQTGLGDNMGSQGVAGLQRSFAISGAKNIIMSLWPVDDNSTQYLMTEFYKNFAATNNVEDSFRKAQASTRAKYSHPALWAAFVLLKTYQ
jgi:CHAT domain-containing protein